MRNRKDVLIKDKSRLKKAGISSLKEKKPPSVNG